MTREYLKWTQEEINIMIAKIKSGITTTASMMKFFPGRSRSSINNKMQALKTTHGKKLKMPVQNLKASNSMILLNRFAK